MFYNWWLEGKYMGDGLDYPETLDDEGPDAFEKPSDLAECLGCAGPFPDDFTLASSPGSLAFCPDCIDAFEREDAPEELAITLGDMSVDDVWDDGGLWEDSFRPYRGFMGR